MKKLLNITSAISFALVYVATWTSVLLARIEAPPLGSGPERLTHRTGQPAKSHTPVFTQRRHVPTHKIFTPVPLDAVALCSHEAFAPTATLSAPECGNSSTTDLSHTTISGRAPPRT